MVGVTLYQQEYSRHNSSFFSSLFMYREEKQVVKELSPESSDTILEIGCNDGSFTNKLSKFCKKVVGIDINEDAIRNSKFDNVKCMSAESLDFKDEVFDKVVSRHTIEHVPELGKAISEMERVIKKSGRIVLLYPYEPVRGLTAIPSACIVHKNPLVCRDLHVHKLKPKIIRSLIRQRRLREIKSMLVFTPLPVYITVLEKY